MLLIITIAVEKDSVGSRQCPSAGEMEKERNLPTRKQEKCPFIMDCQHMLKYGY
jgi:hypothetical protein